MVYAENPLCTVPDDKGMVRLLGDSGGKGDAKEKHISSFQAFAISIASRVGTGNLAGVATAIAVGGPGAVFWMWVIALLGASSSFVESTLAQLYKIKGKDSFIGGPAYYMRKGLKQPWMGALFAVLITITFGFAFNSVQSNTLCAAFEGAFGFDHAVVGGIITALTLTIIFGGVQRIAKVSSIIVPIMALGYIALALIIVLLNIKELPGVLALIVGHAFGWEQALGGGVGMALMQGIKRGLFSNEAGMGSAPNVAATAHVSHPVKQGLIQTLGVFTDTLIICTCTAFIILFSGAPLDGSTNGVQLTQHALTNEIGPSGAIFVAVALFFFAFSSILGIIITEKPMCATLPTVNGCSTSTVYWWAAWSCSVLLPPSTWHGALPTSLWDSWRSAILSPSACSENTLSGCLKTTAHRKAPVSKTPFSPRTA